MPIPVVWLTESAWPGLDERRAHVLGSLCSFARVLILEPPPSLRLPDPAIRHIDGVAIGQVMPFVNTRIPSAQAALRLLPLRRAAEEVAGFVLRQRIRASGWCDGAEPLLVVCSNVFLHRAGRTVRPDYLIAAIGRDPRSVEGAPPWTGSVLASAARDADVAFTPSFRLAGELREMGARDVRLRHEMPGLGGVDVLVQAVELYMGGSARRPSARTARQPSIVEFRGPIGPGVDFPLVHELARRCPELSVRLVGPVDPIVVPQIRKVTRLSNVRHVAAPSVILPGGSGESAPAALIFPLLSAVSGEPTLPASATDRVAAGVPIVSTLRPEQSSVSTAVDVCPSPEMFIQTVRLRARRRAAGSPLWDRTAPGAPRDKLVA